MKKMIHTLFIISFICFSTSIHGMKRKVDMQSMEANSSWVQWILGRSNHTLEIPVDTVLYATEYNFHQQEEDDTKKEEDFFENFNTLNQDIRSVILQDVISYLSLNPLKIKCSSSITEVAIAGDIVVIGSDDGSARIWDINTAQLLQILIIREPERRNRHKVTAVAINSELVAIGADDGTTKIWHIGNGQLLHTFQKHTQAVRSIALNGNMVVTASNDGTAKIWNTETGICSHTLEGHTDLVWSVKIIGNNIVTESRDKTFKIWDIKNGQLLHTLEEKKNASLSVAMVGERMIAAEVLEYPEDKTVKVWDLCTGKVLHLLEGGHIGRVKSSALVGYKIVTGSCDETVKVWDIVSGKSLHTLVGYTGELWTIKVAGDKVIVMSADIKIWNIHTGKLLNILTGAAYSMKAMSDDKMVTSMSQFAEIWTLSCNLKGAACDNPLVWILQKADIPQLNLIERAYETTLMHQDFIIDLPKKLGKVEENESYEQRDGRVYFSLPEHVRKYLRLRLTIRKPIKHIEENQNCLIQ